MPVRRWLGAVQQQLCPCVHSSPRARVSIVRAEVALALALVPVPVLVLVLPPPMRLVLVLPLARQLVTRRPPTAQVVRLPAP